MAQSASSPSKSVEPAAQTLLFQSSKQQSIKKLDPTEGDRSPAQSQIASETTARSAITPSAITPSAITPPAKPRSIKPRQKSAVSPPETALPRSATLRSHPNAKILPSTAGHSETNRGAVAKPESQSVGQALQESSRTQAGIQGRPAQAAPANAEYLPKDFFAALQGNSAGSLRSNRAREGQLWDIAPAPRDPNRPELRGVWMTTSDMEILRDQQALGHALEQLARLNFNTVYPVVWARGYVTYPSEAARAAGIPQLSRGLQSQDLLTDLVQQAHGLGLSVIPWFEYGFMVPLQSEVALLHPDWLTHQRNGQLTEMNSGKAMAWLNPFKAEVQSLMRDLAVDLVSQYDVDGIQFDDHMSLPKAFGYDDETRSRYKAETGQDVPRRATNRAWTQWRADQITYAVANLHRAVKGIQPQLVFSVSPNRYDYAYRNALQDWKAWLERGIIDELIVQAYRQDYRDFVADLRQPEIRQAKAQIPTGVGILTGLSDRRIGMYQIKQQVRAAQSEGLGVSFFFYQSLWDNAPESIAERKSGFRSIFPRAVPRIATRL